MKTILAIIFCICLQGCTVNKQIYGEYKNKNNEISLLENGDFQFLSYDGLHGQNFSIGKWNRNSDNTILLKNRDILPEIKLEKSKRVTNSSLIVNDLRINNHEAIEIYLNKIKIDFKGSSKVSVDSKINLVELYIRDKKIKLITENIDDDFYDLIINVYETYNEFSIDTMQFGIKKNYIYDKKSKRKYYKKKDTVPN